MLTTVSMVQYGKVYQNLMVDMIPTNKKLEDRAVRIIMMATGTDRNNAAEMLQRCGNNVKTAIVCLQSGSDPEAAKKALKDSSGFVGKAIEKIRTGRDES